MPTVSVPRSFFVSERNSVYGDWRSAFWRELLSNSLDAGAEHVHLRTRFAEDGDFVVDVIDNGRGMDRKTVEEVYMRLGASTKGEGDGIGGFGRARILTCFSQKAYRIRTSDVTVSGEGASYEVETASRPIAGCAITIRIDPRDASRLQARLEQVLRQSSLRARITLDLAREHPDGVPLHQIGEDLLTREEGKPARFRGWSLRGKRFGQLEDDTSVWAELHVSKGETAVRNRAVVRVNGMAMYDEHIAAPVQVTVDLASGRAREILTASRDSIRGEFRAELQKVFSGIAADHVSAFRDRSRTPETRIAARPGHGSGLPILRRGQEAPRPPLRPSVMEDPDTPRLEADLEAIRAAQAERRPSQLSPEAQAMADIQAESQRLLQGLRLDLVTHVGDATTAQRAAAPRFQAHTWLSPGSEGRTAELLHAAWTAACRHAIGVLAEIHPYLAHDSSETWITGFVFDRNMLGCHMSAGQVRHALLLNPVDEQGRLRFKLTDPESMKEMVATAIHEVTHIVHDWHDEAYANLLTRMMGKIRDRDIEREIRDELEAARSWIATRGEPIRSPAIPDFAPAL